MNESAANRFGSGITGYAGAVCHLDDAWFDVPLCSHIEGNLWMGGVPVTRLPGEFQYVVNHGGYEPYHADLDAVVLEAPMRDADVEPDPARIGALAKAVNAFCDAGPTLVHCQAGLNRSGLATAAALIERGVTPRDAIALLRARRSPLVLRNRTSISGCCA